MKNLPKFIDVPDAGAMDRLEAETVGDLFDEVWDALAMASDDEIDAYLDETEETNANLAGHHSTDTPSDFDKRFDVIGPVWTCGTIAPQHDVLVLTERMECPANLGCSWRSSTQSAEQPTHSKAISITALRIRNKRRQFAIA